jgi:hypothetical protein
MNIVFSRLINYELKKYYIMKYFFYIGFILILMYSCGSSNKTIAVRETTEEEAIVIENDSLEYKIIILDIGFNVYLNSIARPARFYSQQYLENKNIFYVSEWNRRARNPLRYGGFYENTIDYMSHLDYGLDVNYKLFNYFKFVEYKYKIRLI